MEKKPAGFAAIGEQYTNAVYQKLPPQDKESVQRVVIAGLKLMFSPQTHQYMQQSLNKQGDMAEKLSVGMMQLITILLQKTKGNVPPNVMIPAAAIMLVNACEYVEKTGGEMNTAIFSEALKMMNASISIKVKEAQKPDAQGTPNTPMPPQAGGLMSAPVAA